MSDCIDLIIDGESLSEKGFSLAERPYIPTAEMRVNHIYVDGKDGSWTKEEGYSDLDILTTLNILEFENIKQRIREVKPLIMNAKEIRLSDELDYFYKVKSVNIEDINNEHQGYGYFDVKFVLDPYQYMDTSYQSISNGQNLENLTGVFVNPLIKVDGSGEGSITINSETFEFKNITETIIVDTDLKIVYTENLKKNQNAYTYGPYPRLKPGNNAISWSGGVTSVSINPRWRYL